MKRDVVKLLLVCLVFGTVQSCKKRAEVSPSSSLETLREYYGVSTNANVAIQVNLYLLGHREGITITSQAKNFKASKIEKDQTSGQYLYTYEPRANFKGEDSAIIESNSTALNMHLITTCRITVK